MSQDNPQAILMDAYMLPPSFAVYVQGAVFIPVLVDLASNKLWVAPVVVSDNTKRIHWCLVLMSNDPGLRLEFEEENAIVFKPVGGIIPTGDQLRMSATQIALANFRISSEITEYTLNFNRFPPVPGMQNRLTAVIQADPAISVTPDPVEIPSWP
jgi:hypothetical protein